MAQEGVLTLAFQRAYADRLNGESRTNPSVGNAMAPPSPASASSMAPETPSSPRLWETSDVPVSSRGGAMSFREPSSLPAHLARIDLEAHAVFTALLLVYPDRQPHIYAQYGVRDPGERDMLDRHWRARLIEQPGMGAQWVQIRDHAVAHYRALDRQ
jgi:hypothetical protein